LAPTTIIDYIVVHELCHFHHRDHTNAFWNEVDKVLPDWRERKECLRKNGAGLDVWPPGTSRIGVTARDQGTSGGALDARQKLCRSLSLLTRNAWGRLRTVAGFKLKRHGSNAATRLGES
jgi:hypothetical protein